MSNQKERFGVWLKNQRKAKLLSQRQLAERLSVHYTYISKIETGNIDTMPSEQFYINLSYVLQTSLSEIEDVAGYYDESLVKHNIGVKPELARILRELYEPQSKGADNE